MIDTDALRAVLESSASPPTEPMTLLIHRECGQPAAWIATSCITDNTAIRVDSLRLIDGSEILAEPGWDAAVYCPACFKRFGLTWGHCISPDHD